MIAEIGLALLWLAAACAGLQAVAGLVPQARIPELAARAALLQGWLWLWIIGCLAWAFAQSDMSVAAVADNTHGSLPTMWKLAAVVLRDGGGIFAATAVVAFAGSALAARRRPALTVVGSAGLVAVLLHTALFAAAPPFARLMPAPTDGAGFSPVWRDRFAAIAPIGEVIFDGALFPGEALHGVRLIGLLPTAGPDSTAVEARLAIGATTLGPAWRTTIRPLHSSTVADTGWGRGGWFSATLGPPRPDGRWPVVARRVSPWPFVLLGSGILAGLAWLGRRWWPR